jgi:hypothetical protein
MQAQELMDAAELHRIKGEVWKAKPLWNRLVADFPGTSQGDYAKAQLEQHASEKRNVIVEAWKGQRELGEVFWIYHVFLIAGLYVASLFVPAFDPNARALFILAVAFFWIPYQVWITLALWRCALNASRVFGLLARIYVLVAWIPPALAAVFSLVSRFWTT